MTLLPLNKSEIKMPWLTFPLELIMSYFLGCKSSLAVTQAVLEARCSKRRVLLVPSHIKITFLGSF